MMASFYEIEITSYIFDSVDVSNPFFFTEQCAIENINEHLPLTNFHFFVSAQNLIVPLFDENASNATSFMNSLHL